MKKQTLLIIMLLCTFKTGYGMNKGIVNNTLSLNDIKGRCLNCLNDPKSYDKARQFATILANCHDHGLRTFGKITLKSLEAHKPTQPQNKTPGIITTQPQSHEYTKEEITQQAILLSHYQKIKERNIDKLPQTTQNLKNVSTPSTTTTNTTKPLPTQVVTSQNKPQPQQIVEKENKQIIINDEMFARELDKQLNSGNQPQPQNLKNVPTPSTTTTTTTTKTLPSQVVPSQNKPQPQLVVEKEKEHKQIINNEKLTQKLDKQLNSGNQSQPPQNIKLPQRTLNPQNFVQLVVNQQGPAECGSHSVLNAWAIQQLSQQYLPITSEEVRKQSSTQSKFIIKHELITPEITKLASQVGLKRTIVIAYNNNLTNFYVADCTEDLKNLEIIDSLDTFFRLIPRYLEIEDTRGSDLVNDFHLICHTPGHWVSISVVRHNGIWHLYYCNSTNAQLTLDMPAYNFVTLIQDQMKKLQ